MSSRPRRSRCSAGPRCAFLRAYVVKRQAAGILRPGDPGLLVVALVALPAYFALVDSLLGVKRSDGSDDNTVDLFTRLILDGVRRHADEPTPRGQLFSRERRPQ